MALIRPARWQKWAHIPKAELWQAVALSLDIDPTDDEKLLRDLRTVGRSSVTLTPQQLRADFQDRLQMALANLAFSGPIKPLEAYLGVTDSVHATILLAEFGAWAEGVRLELPEQFPRGAKPVGVQAGGGKWPWGDYETPRLRILSEAVAKWWVNYDPNDQTTAPTTPEVVAWLMSVKGLDKTPAEAIAQMIRPEDIKPGPRRS